jgi:hypothetical protein
VSGPDQVAIFRERALRMVADGLEDRDIAFQLQYDDHADRMQIWEHIRELRARPDRHDVVPPVTQLQREKIPQIPGIVDRLRRSGGISKTGVAARLEIHRDTFDDWIKKGHVQWPPETAE